ALKPFLVGTGQIAPDKIEPLIKGNDSVSPVALMIAIKRGMIGLPFRQLSDEIDFSRITSSGNPLVLLPFITAYAHASRDENMIDQYEGALSAGAVIAGEKGFVRMLNGILLERASLRSSEGRYAEAEADLSSTAKNGLSEDLSLSSQLLSAEIALFSGDIQKGDRILNSLKVITPRDALELELLRAHSERLKIISDSEKSKGSAQKNNLTDDGFKRYEERMKKALNLVDPSFIEQKGLIRKDLLNSGINFLITYNHGKKKNTEALLYEEVKRQINRWEVVGGAGEKLISSVPLSAFQKQIPDDSIVIYISRNGSDLFAWIIEEDFINPVWIRNGYTRAQDITSRYSAAVRQMQNTFPFSIELEQVLSPAFSSVWQRKRVYIIPDKFTELIPFEIMTREKMLAEKLEICYLPSISLPSAERVVTGKGAVFIGEPSEIDSIALTRAGVLKKGEKPAYGHLVSRADLYHGVIVSSTDNEDILRNVPNISALYLSRGISGENAGAFELAAMKKGLSAVIVSAPSVRDVNTVLFAEYFYTRVRGGDDIATAFSKAMKAMIRTAKFVHPAFWAGTRLYMNGLK
ncbi:MAG TPA: CHAT domain-containing protein, partial [Spirochaetota bacterium]